MMAEPTLKSKTAKSIAWNSGGRFIRVSMQFLYIVILARWLSPEDFGIASMALIPFQISTTLATRTFTQSLIQKHDFDDSTASTAFWLNVASSIVVALVIIAFGYITPGTADPTNFLVLMVVISACSPISACSIVSLAELSKAMRFREIAQIESISSVVGFAAGIIALLFLPPLFSIGIYAVAQRLSESCGFFFASRWWPTLSFNRAQSREILRYSLPLYGTTIMTNVIQSVDQFFVAYFIGGAELGFYNFARRVIDQPVRLIMQSFERAIFPAAVQSRSNTVEHDELFSSSAKMITFVSSFVFLSLSVGLYTLIGLLMGEEWEGARIFILIFSLQACFIPIGSVLYAFILANGATYEQFKFTISRMLLVTATSLLLSQLFGWTATELAIAIATVNVALLYPNMTLAARVSGISISEGLKSTLVGFFPPFGAALTAWALFYFLPFNVYLVLALQAVAFTLVSFGLSYLLLRDHVHALIQTIRRKGRKAQA